MSAVITSTKFSKAQKGYKITVSARHETESITADFSVWGTSLHEDALRQARDTATDGVTRAIKALADGVPA